MAEEYEGHTPEPWTLERSERGIQIVCHAGTEDEGEVAYLLMSPIRDSENEANAKLIADAPKLARLAGHAERLAADIEKLLTVEASDFSPTVGPLEQVGIGRVLSYFKSQLRQSLTEYQEERDA